MTNWKQRAAEAVQQNYQPGNAWEAMLSRHLTRCFPELVKDLEKTNDLQAYLRTMTFDAMLLAEKLEDEGAPISSAEEIALAQLLQKPPEEQDLPSQAALEDSAQEMEQAAMRVLLSNPSTNPPPRKIPLT